MIEPDPNHRNTNHRNTNHHNTEWGYGVAMAVAIFGALLGVGVGAVYLMYDNIIGIPLVTLGMAFAILVLKLTKP